MTGWAVTDFFIRSVRGMKRRKICLMNRGSFLLTTAEGVNHPLPGRCEDWIFASEKHNKASNVGSLSESISKDTLSYETTKYSS